MSAPSGNSAAPESTAAQFVTTHWSAVLGVVFYEMLTGELPLGRFAPPSRRVRVDVRLDEVVLRALEKEPERRYQQASQVRSDVETIVSSPDLSANSSNSGATVTLEALPPAVVAVKTELKRASLAMLLLGVALWGVEILEDILPLVLPLDYVRSYLEFLHPFRIEPLWIMGCVYLPNIQHLTGTLALVSAWLLARGRGFDMAHAVFFLTMFQNPILPLSGLLSAYALAILWRKEVRLAFAAMESLGANLAETRLSCRLALASAALVPVSLICLPVFMLGAHDAAYQPGARSALFGTMYLLPRWTQGAGLILGWSALRLIRGHDGAAKQLPRAVFGALFPIFLWIARGITLWEGGWLAGNLPSFEPSLERNLGRAMAALSLAALAAWGWRWRLTSWERQGEDRLASGWRQGTNRLLGVLVIAYAAVSAINWFTFGRSLRGPPVDWCLTALATGLTGWLIHRHLSRATTPPAKEPWRLLKWTCWWVSGLAAVVAGFSLFATPFQRVVLGDFDPGNEGFVFMSHHIHDAVPAGFDPGPFTAHTASGEVVLAAIAEPARGGGRCWLPDGTVRCSPTPTAARTALGPDPERTLWFCLSGDGIEKTATNLHYECAVAVPGGEKTCWNAYPMLNPGRSGLRGICLGVPAAGKTARLRLGVPAENWEDSDAVWSWTGDQRALNKRSIHRAGMDWTFSVARVTETPEGLRVEYAGPIKRDAEARLVIVDTAGAVWTGEYGGGIYGRHYLPRYVDFTTWNSAGFPGMTLKRLKELRFQIRSFQWIEFSPISLRPGEEPK